MSRSLRQHIPLDKRHGPVELRQHPGGEQTSHACTKDNGSLTELVHRTLRP